MNNPQLKLTRAFSDADIQFIRESFEELSSGPNEKQREAAIVSAMQLAYIPS